MIDQRTLDFLFENRMRDSRAWFHEHHKKYEEAVKRPVYDLVAQLEPAMIELDAQILTAPHKVVSRINRDLRYTKDKSLYRDVVWLNFRRDKHEHRRAPAFYFEFSPAGYNYGCGYYRAPTEVMECLRAMIVARDKAFVRAKRAVDKLPQFVIEGERYKRSRHPEQPAALREWLDRKSVYLLAEGSDPGVLFSERLGEWLAGEFRALAPVYDLFLEIDRRVRGL